MRPSKEVRWFFPGERPRSISAWMDEILASGSIPAKHEERSDSYLVLPSSSHGLAEVGLKLRGPNHDKIEVKRLENRETKPRQFADRAEGYPELWIRWSFSIDDEDSAPGDSLQPTEAWITVNKARDSRKFLAAEDGTLTEVPVEADIPVGGAVEITRAEALGQVWWSLGIEVFGTIDGLDHTFDVITRHVFVDNPPPIRLSSENSLSYPDWLLVIN